MDVISCINVVSISALSAYVNRSYISYSGVPVFYLTVINLAICAISGLHEQ